MKLSFRDFMAVLSYGFAVLLLWVMFVSAFPPVSRVEFMPEKWKRSTEVKKNRSLYENRGKMIDDVYEEIQHQRMSRSSVLSMLGEPDGKSRLGLDYGYKYDSISPTYHFLRIRFSPKGEYISARLEAGS